MSRLSWILAAAPTLCLAAACGSGSPRPTESSDASAGGSSSHTDAAAGAAGDASSAGGSAPTDSGTPDSGGTDHDAGDAGGGEDTTPPSFEGVTKVEDAGDGRVTVSWAAATDDGTPAERMLYVVYRAASAAGENFSTARRCGAPLPDAGTLERADTPCIVVAPAGSTSVVVTDVIPGRGYYYVVRAIDAAGNADGNSKEFAYVIDDKTSPEFGGVRAVTALSPTSIQVDWGAAFDLGTADSKLVFQVFLGTTGVPNPDESQPAFVSAKGQHTAIVTESTKGNPILPSTAYNVLVRAYDEKGNHDDNVRTLKIITPEGIPPAFSGVKRADASGTTIRLFWQPATDNVTDPENIEYDVYESLTTHGQDFSKPPTYTSLPGVSSMAIPNLQPGTTYYYVVRARDAAGNRDVSQKQVQATTKTPDKRPPTFQTGVQSVTSDTPGTIKVTWAQGADDTSKADEITYRVYVSTTSQLPLSPTATPTASIRGVTTMTLGGYAPGTQLFVVVRAEDAVGNLQTSTDVEKSGTTLAADPSDTTAPVMGNTVSATPVTATPGRMTVSWTAATDASGAGNVRYLVCASKTEADCLNSAFATHIVAATAFGTTTATLSALTPRTNYFVYVRAEDKAGNVESSGHPDTATTATSWAINVRPVLFNRCIACHDTYDNQTAIFQRPVAYLEDGACIGNRIPDQFGGCPLYLIDPGRPEYSMIYRKVNPLNLNTGPFATVPNNYDGLQMPRDSSSALSPEEDDILLSWIKQGALAN